MYLALDTGVWLKIERKDSSVSCSNSSKRGDGRGAKAGSDVMGASEFQGQTSWQMSQPNTLVPIAAWNSSGMGPRSSMVR